MTTPKVEPLSDTEITGLVTSLFVQRGKAPTLTDAARAAEKLVTARYEARITQLTKQHGRDIEELQEARDKVRLQRIQAVRRIAELEAQLKLLPEPDPNGIRRWTVNLEDGCFFEAEQGAWSRWVDVRGHIAALEAELEASRSRAEVAIRSYSAAAAERDALKADAERVRDLETALRFYADGHHFDLSGKDNYGWDTVSGEPTNWWCDDAGTATVEDGFFARQVLDSTELADWVLKGLREGFDDTRSAQEKA